MTLGFLLADVPGLRLVRGNPGTPVITIEHDSRRVVPGALFIAIKGFTSDGHDYLATAARDGATAALVEAGRDDTWRELPEDVAVLTAPDTRLAMAGVAAWFYGHPGREMTVVGVTGTDGKTTTAHLITGVLEASGAKVGRLGTVDVYLPGEQGKVGNRMSTPEAPEVQRLLRKMADAGCGYAIVESTSHGLALHRLDGVEYDFAVLTNVTGDHLDFHRTFEAYREAKSQLFAALGAAVQKGVQKTAIVNADDPSAAFMLAHAPGAVPLRYAVESTGADVQARNVRLRADGSSFQLVTPAGSVEATVHLPARFNVANALAAASVGVAAGMTVEAIAAGLAATPGVPGRMERVDTGQPFTVIVDYAHTGDAVRKVLEVLRGVTTGKLIIVVGAAGERDPGRRFGVGRSAAEGADIAIFTNEDPRSEDPAAIVREIGSHAEGAGRVRGRDFFEIEDRREAIREAVRRAAPGDVVLLAGKGHEQSMVYGTQEIPWDDRAVAREELAALGYGTPQA
jgi:UDP-N-acetylmuramoyl-L-alanyl-D-glutamate--2,6-diaminopimelate ligase